MSEKKISGKLKKVLFINHEETRSGAPIVLLQFLHWLKEHHKEINITVLSLRAGPLGQEFQAVSDDYYLFPKKIKSSFLDRIIQRVLRKKKESENVKIIQYLTAINYDIIYGNTVVTLPLAYDLKQKSRGSKLVAHIHELEIAIETLLPNFKEFIPDIDRLIAVSDLVKDNLVVNYMVPAGKVQRVYEFSRSGSFDAVKKSKNFVVGGAGTVEWRKGSDLFLQVAHYIKTHFPQLPIKFVWIGKITRDQEIMYESELRKTGLKNTVSFEGEKTDPQNHFSNFDILLLPSREDPFPLVGIEAGMMGKPIICFEKAVGTGEILKKGGGVIVPYMDVQQMAEEVVKYCNNREKLEADGREARQLFSSFTAANLAPEIYKILKETIFENLQEE